MSFYNKILESLVLPIGDLLLGSSFMYSLKTWRKIQNLPEQEIKRLHDENLSHLLQHAVTNVAYYKQFKRNANSPKLQDFPILTKSLIRENIDMLLWHPKQKEKLVCEKSSGSSGIQGEVFVSRKEQSVFQGIQTLTWEWAGFKIGKPLLQTGITPKRGLIKLIKDALLRTKYISAFNLNDEYILAILKKLDGSSFFGGYASSLWLFAETARKFNVDVKFDNVISWGDKMFPHYRKSIEEQFGCKVFDTYGTTEGFMIAAQMDLPYYYILSPHVHLELLDDQGNEVPDGEIGHVVVTRLDAFEMPLIRYYLGDLAIRLPRNLYPQQRAFQFPLLERIIGRDTDIVKTPSGERMIVHFFTGIFEHFPQVAQFRVVQDRIEEMTIEYIPGVDFNEEVLTVLQNRIQEQLKEPFLVHFLKVDNISPSPSGKPQIIKSTIVQ